MNRALMKLSEPGAHASLLWQWANGRDAGRISGRRHNFRGDAKRAATSGMTGGIRSVRTGMPTRVVKLPSWGACRRDTQAPARPIIKNLRTNNAGSPACRACVNAVVRRFCAVRSELAVGRPE
jgi:hypothetical protein